ncbi:MAG: HAD family phosphatase [Candidatus Acidulodesulfobacterium acidiphilum]|uniref:HAD family phosphatase n=1 Tax=Candidatus Acidulodesulfobacterium acidiphilum TaxID=2597224 RepID=A0A520X9N3_9DELT|nr:MAG: HAD family phosphatase [Candidatus Acidulodesulfobacterium acidiphilum]
MDKITTLFLDIGNILLTNGWDTASRKLASKTFDLDYEEFAERHGYLSSLYEEGRITLNDYLDKAIFYEERSFLKADFKNFMFNQSKAIPEMIELFKHLKSKYNLKIVALNNEGLELSRYRVETFKLTELIDFFVTSCFVKMKKPDENIYKLAMDLAYVTSEESLFIDDRYFNVETAAKLGMNAFQHKDYVTTKEKLAQYGLKTDTI